MSPQSLGLLPCPARACFPCFVPRFGGSLRRARLRFSCERRGQPGIRTRKQRTAGARESPRRAGARRCRSPKARVTLRPGGCRSGHQRREARALLFLPRRAAETLPDAKPRERSLAAHAVPPPLVQAAAVVGRQTKGRSTARRRGRRARITCWFAVPSIAPGARRGPLRCGERWVHRSRKGATPICGVASG